MRNDSESVPLINLNSLFNIVVPLASVEEGDPVWAEYPPITMLFVVFKRALVELVVGLGKQLAVAALLAEDPLALVKVTRVEMVGALPVSLVAVKFALIVPIGKDEAALAMLCPILPVSLVQTAVFLNAVSEAVTFTRCLAPLPLVPVSILSFAQRNKSALVELSKGNWTVVERNKRLLNFADGFRKNFLYF